MLLQVRYSAGVWEFEISSEDGEEDFHDVFEITELSEAQDEAFEAIASLQKLGDAEDDGAGDDSE